MFQAEGFDKNVFTFRSEYDPSKRDKDYFLNNIQALYSEYLKGASTVGYSGISRLEILKAFSEGRQPYYRPDLNPEETQQKNTGLLDQNGNALRSNSVNEDFPLFNWNYEVWDVLSPANKINNTLEGTLCKIDYDINADPMDYGTKREVEDNQLERWELSQNRRKYELAAQVAGINMPMPEFMPESPEELDIFVEEFMPAHVRFIEQVVKHTFDISNWAEDVKVLFIRDLLIGNMACVRNEYDPATGKIKVRYQSPSQADIQKSQHIDCRDSERAWSFYLMNVSELRQYFPDKPEEFFKTVASTFAGMFDNPLSQYFNKYTVQQPWGGYGYDSFKCVVGHFEWIDIDKRKFVEGTKKGRRVVKEVPFDSTVEQDKTVKFKESRVRMEAKWLVGHQEVFEYGPSYENDDCLTYKWIVLRGKSLNEQLIPIYKNFQDLWEKYRELLQNSQGKIQFIDVDMMASAQGATDEGPQVAAKKAFRRFLRTNKLFFRRMNSAGMLQNQGAPIAEMDGGMGTLFEQIQEGFKTNIDLVEYITGLNPLSLGATPNPEMPVTTSQMAMNATSNTLHPIVNGYMSVYKAIGENAANWIIKLVRGNEFSRDAYAQVIGDYGVQSLVSANKRKTPAQYGIKLQARANDVEKQWLLENLRVATTPVPGGDREISTADGNAILNMIMSGTPVKTVQFYFELARKRQEKAVMVKKMKLIKEQEEANNRNVEATSKAKMLEEQQAHSNKMDQIRETNKGLIGNTAVQEKLRTQKDLGVQELKNKGGEPSIIPVPVEQEE